MKRWILLSIFAVFVTCVLAGCASTPRVDRLDVESTVDISGRWNDSDSRMVAEEMIQDCLDRPC